MKKLIILGACVIAIIVAIIIVGANKNDDNESFGAELVRPAKDATEDVESDEVASEESSIAESSDTEVTSEAISYKDAEVLRVTSFTSEVKAGDEVTLSLIGMPNTRYDIYVYYSKKPSTDENLEPKMSDGEGNITWTWRVPTSTDAGLREIAIVGGGEILYIYLDIA